VKVGAVTLRKLPTPPEMEETFGMAFRGCYRAHHDPKLTVIHTRTVSFGHHLSIAHDDRYPTWDEVRDIRYLLVPAEHAMAMLLPPPDQYVNVHENCFQLIEVIGKQGALGDRWEPWTPERATGTLAGDAP